MRRIEASDGVGGVLLYIPVVADPNFGSSFRRCVADYIYARGSKAILSKSTATVRVKRWVQLSQAVVTDMWCSKLASSKNCRSR